MHLIHALSCTQSTSCTDVMHCHAPNPRLALMSCIVVVLAQLNANTVHSKLAAFTDHKILGYGPAFPPGYRASPEELAWALDLLRFNAILVAEARRFIEHSLPRPYIAVHLRMWDNINCLNYPHSNDANCFPSNDALDRAIERVQQSRRNADTSAAPIRSMFLATDATRPSRDQHLIDQYNAKLYDGVLLDARHSTMAAVLDMVVCSEADVFIGSVHSSFSLHIQQMRTITKRASQHDDVIIRVPEIKWLFDDWWSE
jgi:hypothetical protein